MGIPTPGYYDNLFLEKAKLLLQAALNNPRRKGGPTSYDEFVVALDTRDEATQRAFDVILQETTLRRPRKVEASASSSGPASTSTRRVRDPADLRRSIPHAWGPITTTTTTTSSARNLNWDGMSSDDSSASDDDPGRAAFQGGDRYRASDEARILDAAAAMRERHLIRSRLLSRPLGIPAATTSTNERPPPPPLPVAASAAGTSGEPSPSEQLRQREMASLFGFSEPLPSLSQVLADISPASTSTASRTTPPPAATPSTSTDALSGPTTSHNGTFPELPTFEELWQVLLDDPFPSASVDSFPSFLDRLNSTSLFNTPLRSPDMNALLADLTVRDPVVPIRVRNAVRNRRHGPRGSPPTSTDDQSASAGSAAQRQEQYRTEMDRANRGFEALQGVESGEHPLREGIWRTSFVEHLEDDDVDVERERGSGENHDGRGGDRFVDFTRRRRAATRERESEGLGPREPRAAPPPPVVTITSASTPATSLGSPVEPSAVSTSCPPAPLAPPSAAPTNRPLTSAEIARALLRAQRTIAPLPPHPASSSSSSTSTSNPTSSSSPNSAPARRLEGSGSTSSVGSSSSSPASAASLPRRLIALERLVDATRTAGRDRDA
ncbi:hypothetical protein JCM10212_006526 [Sporobolomyces blumeae]